MSRSGGALGRSDDRSPRELVLVAAAIGVILGAFPFIANAFAAHWGVHAVPKGDLSIIEWNVMQAARGDQIGGMYSRYGWSHLGPAYFYWLAAFYRLFGAANGIWVGAAALAALSLALSLQAWRTLTSSPALLLIWTLPVFGVTFLLVTSQLDRFMWTPVVTVFPYLLLVSASLAVARERWWWLSVALPVHSLLVQTHVAFLLAATATLGFGVAWGVAAFWRRERVLPRPKLAIAALHVAGLAALWLPIFVEVARPGGSNLSRVFRFFLAQRLNGSFTSEATRLLMQALSRPVEGLVQLVTAAPFGEATRCVVVIAATIATVAALITSARRRSDKGLLLASGASLQLVLAVVGMKGMVDQPLDYLLFWMSAAAVVPWLAGSYTLFEHLQELRRSWIGPAAIALVAVLATTASARAWRLREPLRWHSDYSRGARDIADLADARMPPRSRVRIEGPEGESLSLAILLRRKGHRPVFPDRPGTKPPQFLLLITDEPREETNLGEWQGKVVELVTLNQPMDAQDNAG